MRRVALTGNIASGKSQVERLLLEYGFSVIDADKIVAELYENADFVEKLGAKFKKYNFIKNNVVDRKKLAELVFCDDTLKKEIEFFVHPFVFGKIEEFFVQNATNACAVASVPLLFECGGQKYFDKTVLVTADDLVRQKRLMARNGLSSQQAQLRMNAQMPQSEKISFADFVVENNGDLTTLNEKVKILVGWLNGG